MAVFNEPTKWQTSLVNSGDANVIPQSTPVGTGEASFNDGFPQITQIPIGAGGIAPDRKDFNGLFKILGDWIFFNQNGGVSTYSENFDYIAGRVVSYNDNIYLCIQDNSALNKHAPTDAEYWLRFTLNNELVDYLPLAGGNVTGNLSVQNKNVVRSVNGVNADASGNVTLQGASFGPDYTSVIEGITFPYTAPQDGIISLFATTNSGNAYFSLTVDDVTVISYDTLNVNDIACNSFIIPIKKGSVAKIASTGGTISFINKFIPYGG